MSRHEGKLVQVKDAPKLGVWKIVVWGTTIWAGCVPSDETSKALAVLTTDGVAWFRKAEIRTVEIQGQETLL